MSTFAYTLQTDPRPNIGLVVLQSDERIEQDFRRIVPLAANLYISRVPSSPTVTAQTLRMMESHIPAAARLFPGPVRFDALGYGCTSATAQIGQTRVGQLLHEGASAGAVSDPLSALVAACGVLGLRRLGFLSPYVEDVSDQLRQELRRHGIESPVFGTFAEAEEERVVRISQQSLVEAGLALADQGGIDGLFLSCTNLNTLDLIGELERAIDLPVLSSNLVLGWHLCDLAGVRMQDGVGRSRLAQAGISGID